MIRFTSLLAASACCVILLPAGTQAENNTGAGAGADWAKRAAGAKDSKATPKIEQPAAADAESTGEREAEAEDATDEKGWTQRVMSPIFSQLVMISQPVDFVVRFENTKDGSYIREAVPKGETVEDWTQMITVTGLKGASQNGNLTPQGFFENIAGGFKRACPETFASAALKPVSVNDHPAYAGVASCGSVQAGAPRSETAAILVIQGKQDFYTLQWAEREEPSTAPLAIDADMWRARLEQLMPIDLCDLDASKKAACR